MFIEQLKCNCDQLKKNRNLINFQNIKHLILMQLNSYLHDESYK